MYMYQYFNIIAGPIFVKRMLKRIVYVPIKVKKKKNNRTKKQVENIKKLKM